MYKLASEYVKNFVICLDLLFYFVPNLQLILYVRVFWRITMWCRGIIYVMPYRINKKTLKIKDVQKIDVWILVFVLGSYMISW